jgi:mannobiose 2-epimerase
MIPETTVRSFRQRVESELRQDILPFWMSHTPDEQHGGFAGAIENDLTVRTGEPKGVILNARILWAFSHAYRIYGEQPLLWMAERANDYLLRHFRDPDSGGVYWTVDCRGEPLDTNKKIYAQAFSLYAWVEYFRAAGDDGALERALDLFRLIESRAADPLNGGYLETFTRDWSLAQDQRLSDVDMDEKKSMNTNLHVLEAYASLADVADDVPVKKRLEALLEVFLAHILDPRTHHFRMFFDEVWTPRSDHISFGHDIEGSWLLCEAAYALGNRAIRRRTEEAAIAMARAVLAEARNPDGSLSYEADPGGVIDDNRDWWPQAEAVVGFLNAYELTGEEAFLQASIDCWDFIDRTMIDKTRGEWYWRVTREGMPDASRMKVDQWKCPYHNARMCFEVMARLDRPDRVKDAGPQAGASESGGDDHE